jgi:hypothetical protein
MYLVTTLFSGPRVPLFFHNLCFENSKSPKEEVDNENKTF